MNLSDQVCDLELAIRLKELGVGQDSYFYWCIYEKINEPEILQGIYDYCCYPKVISVKYGKNDILESKEFDGGYEYDEKNEDIKETFSSFNVSELLELLPMRLTTIENEPFNSFRFRLEKSFHVKQENNILHKEFIYIANYYCDSTECTGEEAWIQRKLIKNIHDTNPANVLAMTLIYIMENMSLFKE